MTVTLGLNIFHADSAACIFIGHKLAFAIEEERLNRKKHWAGIPFEAITVGLENCGLKFSDVDYIALNFNRWANIDKKILFSITRPQLIFSNIEKLLNRQKQASIKMALESHFNQKFDGEIIFCEHHRAHHLSSLIEAGIENAALVSIDGFGDFTSTSLAHLENNRVKNFSKVFFPHSIGIFYSAITQLLGFNKYGDEYKVMGLAAYGKPNFTSELKKVIKLTGSGQFKLDLRYFLHHKHGNTFIIQNGEPVVKKLFSPLLENLLISQRQQTEPIKKIHKDIAASLQEVYESIFLSILNHAWNITGEKTVCLSGGCAMNSLANGKVLTHTNFEKVIIPPSPGDSGGAIGAAINVINKKLIPFESTNNLNLPYFGTACEKSDLDKIVLKAKTLFKSDQVRVKTHDNFDDTARETAARLARGMVVGWFQNRSEWGPRALGNRSILADPRNPDIKALLNLKIKKREGFRPFAPSILSEHQPEWFESDASVPFMSQVFKIKKNKRKEIPAVVHRDGTGRLQSVLKSVNPKYHQLITEFYAITQIPMILNTSFNENEPIVERPIEAFEVFLKEQIWIFW